MNFLRRTMDLYEIEDDNAKVFELVLDADDNSKIISVTSKARDLFEIIGDCGSEYR